MAARVPEDPDLFFTEFFPEQYDAYPAFPRATTPGCAAFEVSGVGAWALRVSDRKLRVERGVPNDCVLRLATSPADFTGLFVRRAEASFGQRGELSNELRHAFFPLFMTERKKAIALETSGTLLLLLKDADADFRLSVVPGLEGESVPKASVRLWLSDFLGLAGGRKKVPLLLATGRLSVRGDMAHALRLSGLLA